MYVSRFIVIIYYIYYKSWVQCWTFSCKAIYCWCHTIHLVFFGCSWMVSRVKVETFQTLSAHRWHFIHNSVQCWRDSCEKIFSYICNPVSLECLKYIINWKRKGWFLFRSSPIYFSLVHFKTLRKSRAEIDEAYLFFEIYAEWLFPMNGTLVLDFLCFCDTLSLRARRGANVTYETVRWWQVKTIPHRHTSKHYYPVWQEVRCMCLCEVKVSFFVKSLCALNGESLNQCVFANP